MTRQRGLELTKSAPELSAYAAEFTAEITKAEASKNQSGDTEWIIEGYASTGDMDRHGDVILPTAFTDTLKAFVEGGIILFNHDRDQPIGRPTDAKVTDKGLWIRARIVDAQKGKLIEQGILNAFSVGIAPPSNADDIEIKEVGGRAQLIWKRAELVETSVVTVPANAHARFTVKKDFRAATLKSWQPSTQTEMEGITMFLKLICKMLGLPDSSDEATVLAELQARMGAMKAAALVGEVTKALGLTPDASGADVAAAVASLRKPEGFVAKADHDAVVAELRTARAEKLLAPYAKRIPEKLQRFAKQLAEDGDEEGVKAIAESTPQAPTTPVTGAGANTPPEGSDNVNEDEATTPTPEDEHFTKTLGYFRDERKDGRIIRKAADAMMEMANATGVDAIEWLFDQRIPAPTHDVVTGGARTTSL